MPSLNSPPYKIHKRFLSGHFDSYITYVLVLSIYDKTRKRDWSPKDLKREELTWLKNAVVTGHIATGQSR